MRKFLTVSVCLFASLMANAKVVVTPGTTDLTKVEPDVITISGPADEKGNHISSDDVKAARELLNMSAVKIVTDGIELTKDDWQMIIKNYKSEEQLIKDGQVYKLDLSDTHSTSTAYADAQVGYLICAHGDINNVTLSRYNDIPDGFFNNYESGNIETITIPDQKDGTEAIKIGNSAFLGMKNLYKLYIGSCVSDNGDDMALGEGIFAECPSLTTITFNTPNIKVLPTRAFENCTSLKQVDLPNRLEVVGVNAFHHCSLETITFPNTLKTIKENAFDQCDLEYVVIPENVESIESYAFQRNKYLSDVYVMGSRVKCSEAAFLKEQICSSFRNTDHSSDNRETPADRTQWTTDALKDYYYQNPAVLHFPANEEARNNYENPYYTLLNATIDGVDILDYIKNNNIEKKSDEKAKQLARDFNLWRGEETIPDELIDYANGKGDCPFAYYKYIGTDGKPKTCRVWRYDEGHGFYNTEAIANSSEYAGWRQFLIIQDDAKHDVFDDVKRIDDRWYSMCFPFNLTANQIRTAYGAGTEVCEFIGAWDTGNVTAKNEKIINFRFKPLLSQKDNEELNREEDDENTDSRAVSPIITRANKAYMIHPASKKEGDNTNVWHRIIPGIPAEDQIGDQTKIIETVPEEHVHEIMEKMGIKEDKMLRGYKFLGNYDGSQFLPGNSYYFAYKDEGETRTLILNNLTEQSTRFKWTPMTALVKYTGSSTAAKCFSAFSFSSDTEEGATTGIEEININRKPNTTAKFSQKIYNMNGQVVKEGTSLEGLSKGIYIINGKKYIVK